MADTKLNIKEFLDKDEQKDLLRFLTAGSVDDGKSTLIGRLLFDSKKIYEDQLDALERDSKRMGNAGEHIDYALLLDGLKAEREQGITIDVAYRYFSTNNRKFIIADTPGHEQYTRNMITGGSTANLAIILVDARTGVITQTCRHTYLVSLLGIKHVVLAVNKMDLVDFDKDTFDRIVADYKRFVEPLDIPDITYIPLSALDGDNVVEKSDRTPWYEGTSLLDYLENVPIDLDRNYEDFRYPVQYVLRPNLDFRGFSGKVASGIVRKGDTVMALPSGKTSKVKSIVTYEGELEQAFPPQCITITLEDEIDISRGEMLVHPDNLPIRDRNFEAMLVWMDEEAMDVNKQFYIKQTTHTTRARVDSIRYKVNVNTMEQSSVDHLELNEIGRVVFTTGKELFFDPYRRNKQTGSFILIDPITNNTSAVGMIIDRVDAKDMVTEDALAKFGIPFDKNNMLIKTGMTFEEGKKAADILVERNIPFNAIFAFTETLAIGAMNRLRELGKKIPEEIAVASFSGTELSNIVYPKLTTVEPPLYQMGKKAAELILEKIKDPASPNHSIVLDAEIKMRASTPRLEVY